MCEGMLCGAMMWGGWVIGILSLVVLLLGAAALVKYLRSRWQIALFEIRAAVRWFLAERRRRFSISA